MVGDTNNVSPALGSDGTLYASFGTKLSALHPDGTIVWSADLGDWVRAVSLAGDGAIYAAAGEHLAVLGASGALANTINVGSAITSEIAIDRDGTAVFGVENGKLVALSPGVTP